MENIPKLYKQYYIDKNDERLALFKLIKENYQIEKGIYPGCFVHITPSFVINNMTYVDSDKRILKFFRDPITQKYIEEKKEYNTKPTIEFYQQAYSAMENTKLGNFDLLLSFYAGFISKYFKNHLKRGGILLANNSHGDASVAYLDNDYKFISAIKRNGNNFKLITENLDQYFKKKNGGPIDQNKIMEKMTGEKYILSPYAYVFKRR